MPRQAQLVLVAAVAAATEGPHPSPTSAISAGSALPALPLELFVDAERGYGDSATGGAEAPFSSLGDAVAAVRAVPRAQRCAGGGATVTIAGGVYGGSANHFSLTDADSGCPGAPVVFRAAPGDSRPVVVHAGAPVPPSAFSKDSTTPSGLTIWKADLGALGLAELAKTSGHFRKGWNCANGNRTELFFGGNAMTLARHPNKAAGSATWQYLRQGATISPTSFDPGTDDTTGGKPVDPTPWAKEAGDLWVHGFWSWDWADSFAKVTRIDSNGTVR